MPFAFRLPAYITRALFSFLTSKAREITRCFKGRDAERERYSRILWSHRRLRDETEVRNRRQLRRPAPPFYQTRWQRSSSRVLRDSFNHSRKFFLSSLQNIQRIIRRRIHDEFSGDFLIGRSERSKHSKEVFAR